jgi:hypothetical protein
MLTFDVPDVPSQYAAVALIHVSQAQQVPQGAFNRTVGVCQLVRNPASLPGNPGRILASNSIGPGGAVVNYFKSIEGRTIAYSAEASLLQKPKHGQLRATGDGGYVYLPDAGYFGADDAAFQVSIGGMQERVVYSIHVVDEVIDQDTSKLCPRYVWRIAGVRIDNASVPVPALQSPDSPTRNPSNNLHVWRRLSSTSG